MRLYEIDLLRFCAAAGVLLYHYTFRGFAGGLSPVAFPEMAAWTRYGYLGVPLFFMISGFVILMTAWDRSPSEFVVSRVERLYPAFWFCCTASAIIQTFLGGGAFAIGLGQYLVNMTMGNGFVGVESVDNVYWSLFVEMKFYLLVWLLIALRQIRRAELWFSVWFACAVLADLLSIPGVGRLLMPNWAPFLVAGAVFYLIRIQGVTAYRVALLAACYGWGAWTSASKADRLVGQYGTEFHSGVIAGVMAAFFLLFFLVALGLTRRVAFRWYAVVGALTYPLYLIHQDVGYVVFRHFGGTVGRYPLLGGLTLGILVAALLVHRCVERPFAKQLGSLTRRAMRRWIAGPAGANAL